MKQLGKAMSVISTLLIFLCIGALLWWGLSAISTDPNIAAEAGGDAARGQSWMTGSARLALFSGVGSVVLGYISKRMT